MSALGEPHLLMVKPPSTDRVCPEIHEAAGLVRNKTAAAISSGVPKRPRAVFSMMDCVLAK